MLMPRASWYKRTKAITKLLLYFQKKKFWYLHCPFAAKNGLMWTFVEPRLAPLTVLSKNAQNGMKFSSFLD